MGRELENIDLTVAQRKEIIALLKRYLPDTEIWAYGSRVKFTAKTSSDLDMVAFTTPDQNMTIYNLKEAFEESSLPFRVDLFVWDEVPKQFHKNIEDERTVLQKKTGESELPEGWEEKTVGECCPFTYGKSLHKKKRADTGRIPVFGSNGFVGIHSSACVNQAGIIIGRKGTVGVVTFSPEPFWPIDTTFYVTSDNHRDLRYTYYLLKSIGLESMNADSAVPGLNRDAAHSRKICVPPLPEQRAIAHILGSLDDKIGTDRRMNETLEAMSQALFKSWFIDFDPVIDKAPAAGNEIPEELRAKAERHRVQKDKRRPLPADVEKLFPAEFEYTDEMGWIPKGWGVGPFEMLIAYVVDNRGKIPPLSSNKSKVYPLIEVNALKGGNRFSDKNSIRKYVNETTYNHWFRKGHPNEGDVLLSTVGSIGEVCLVGDAECCVAQNIISLRSKANHGEYYLYELLKYHKSNILNLDISSVQPSIKVPHLMNMKVLDGHGLHESFACLVSGYSERYKNNQKQLVSLSSIWDTLLPKLLSGEIRVSEAEKLVEKKL